MDKVSREIARILEARFGKTQAQALLFGRARMIRQDIQFMDVKHVSELCERYRERVRKQITAYRLWERAQQGQHDALAQLYGAAEGVLLHRRVSDEFRLWLIAHKDYHWMRRAYLTKLMGPKVRMNWKRAA